MERLEEAVRKMARGLEAAREERGSLVSAALASLYQLSDHLNKKLQGVKRYTSPP